MANDGQIVFEVSIDGKTAKANIRDITAAIQKETKNWDTAAKDSTDNIGNSFSSMLKKITAGFTAVKVGKALLDFGSAAVSAASDLEEVQNVVDVTFGDNAGKIQTWAENARTQFGLTETQAKKFTSTMGAMLKSSGLAGDQIVDISTDLAGLAADMASFYNLDFEEAFSKIRSGISGQTMPLKELGIDMSVATLNAFALKQGLEKTFDQMSQGEQTMLRYQYLMSATADAQGDFARTSDSYANAVRTLETNFESLKTKIGEVLLPAVSSAVESINGFLTLIQSDGETRTVLDDFNDIDVDTEDKLSRIRETAEEARALIDEMDKIGGSKADQAGSKVQQLVDGLAGIDLKQDKTSAVKDFLNVLSSNIGVISDIRGESADEAKAWLEGIADSASKLSPDDAAGWETLFSTIREGLPGIEDTEFGASFFGAFSQGLSGVEGATSTLDWVIDSLGNKTNKTAQEQEYWLEVCKRLVQTIPGLSSIINTETGEVKGGTQAIKDYVKAWEDGQTKLALIGALEEKESALSSRFADIPGLQLDVALAEKKVRDQKAKLDAIREKYGFGGEGYELIVKTSATGGQGVLTEAEQEWNDAVTQLGTLRKSADDANSAYKVQADALAEAKQALVEYKAAIEETYGSTEQAAEMTAEWSEEAKANAQTLVEAAKTAATELADHIQGVRESVASAVNSTVKGFESIQTPMQKNKQTVKDLTDKMANLDSTSSTYAEDLKTINDEIAKTNSTQISAQSMGKNLADQAQYMEEYLANLRKARELGVSDEVLAQLSDGSEESYDYLEALANAAPGEVETINANYQAVIDKKKELTDELTGQQLTVDQTYQSLADKAREAVAALDLEQSAKDNAGKTVAGVAQGIADHVPEVQTAVDSIIAQLDRLSGFGIDIDLGGFGNIKFTTSTGQTEGSGRFGLDYIPHDDYIARLHEGEKVLTAQEASIYRGLANGSLSGVDLDQLGGVMRDNVKAGGNVYLDGKIVGSVVSSQQGRSFKSLQRSGWQS